MNKHSNFGYSTILLSFIIICIITFTALTLLTANSDYKLSKKVADRNSAFYAAEELAYADLADIDWILAECYRTASDKDTYFKTAAAALSARFDGSLEEKDGSLYFSFSKNITADQNLEVSLLLRYPENDIETFLVIEKWQSVHTQAPFEDQPLNLIGGDN